jgi:hypothetical protein
MTTLPQFEFVGGHRIPRALANDPPFRFLVEAFEGRSQRAAEGGQLRSTWPSRQKFLDLVHRRTPASDIASLLPTINAAIFFYDQTQKIDGEDFVFLAALLQFLKDFHLIPEHSFEAVSQAIQARVEAKGGRFEAFLLKWHRKKGEEAFERELVHATETAERMQKNRLEAERRRAEVRERTRQVSQEEAQREPRAPERAKLGPELRNRLPERRDLDRLVTEERSLVHAIKEEAWKSRPINWLALGRETFFNELRQEDYMNLADMWGEIEVEELNELSEDYVTPPGSPMRTESMAVAEERRGEEVDQQLREDNTVSEMYKYGGAFALISLEFDYKPREDAQMIRVRLNGLHGNGKTYRAIDVKTSRPLEDSVHPRELTIGRTPRGRRDPVILLLQKLKMPTEAYLEPLAERPRSGLRDYFTPESQFGLHAEERRASGLRPFAEQAYEQQGGGMMGAMGRRGGGTPQLRAHMSPPPQRSVQQFGPQMGHAYQPAFRPSPVAGYNLPVHGGAGAPFAFHQREVEEEGMQAPMRGQRRERFEGFGMEHSASPYPRPQREGRFGRDPLEERIAALEEDRQIERARGAMSLELRRMQSAVSPFDHPGVYSHIDDMVTIHELSRTWAGPMTVAGASGNVLISDNVKLAFLKEAIWEFTKRKCAEAGEVLTERQIRDVEAQTLEFYGKQRVEAKKLLEKARINPGKMNK